MRIRADCGIGILHTGQFKAKSPNILTTNNTGGNFGGCKILLSSKIFVFKFRIGCVVHAFHPHVIRGTVCCEGDGFLGGHNGAGLRVEDSDNIFKLSQR
jgi:hypothetical protein